VNDVLVFLTQTEFEILLYLIENKNKIVTRQDLISNSWKEKTNYEKYTVALYSHIKNVKKKIEENNVEDYIETIYGVGYIIREKPTS
jgi:DNA-binding response OmpR family regulator